MALTHPGSPQLTEIQQVILDCVQANPGKFSRSGLAKLLVGSRSKRTEHARDHPYFARLHHLGRKEITYDIEIMLQQGFLEYDPYQRLMAAAGTEHG